jgi:hypothetical protein
MRWPKWAAIVSKDISRSEALSAKATSRLEQACQRPLRFQASVRFGSGHMTSTEIHDAKKPAGIPRRASTSNCFLDAQRAGFSNRFM